jgi:hypothetical protein
MVNQSVEFLIYKEVETLYEYYRKLIPCFSEECLVRVMCCQEKKASKNAKYLAYRIKLNKPCKEVYDILGGLMGLPRHLYLIKRHRKNGNISWAESFEEDVRNLYKKLELLEYSHKNNDK